MKFYTRRAPLVTARQQKGWSPSQERDQPVAHRTGRRPAAEIARPVPPLAEQPGDGAVDRVRRPALAHVAEEQDAREDRRERDRKSTRLNSSHSSISYAVFCLKKKNKKKSESNRRNKRREGKRNK